MGKKKKKEVRGNKLKYLRKGSGQGDGCGKGGDAQPRSAGASYKASTLYELLKSPAPLRCSHPVVQYYLLIYTDDRPILELGRLLRHPAA